MIHIFELHMHGQGPESEMAFRDGDQKSDQKSELALNVALNIFVQV